MTTPNTAPVKTIPVMRSTPPALATCNAASCRRPIEWVTTLYGKRRMPVDSPLIVVDAVERDGGLIVWIESRQSHFVSCPEALAFRDRVENKTRSVKRNPRRRDARW